MNAQSDQQLLREYAEGASDAAFAELVRRYIDFVYSAALRMVRDANLAEDVTQAVFVTVAGNARQLVSRPVLSGWLHRTARNLAVKAIRSETRRRIREQESAAMNEPHTTDSTDIWAQVAPQLDEALDELTDADRNALLLRYFDRKSAREIAETLGTSEEAAQKRVNRAVERLRESFAKRGVTVGASGLAVVISASAIHAAPAGLAATIASAAGASSALAAITTSTTAKAIAMTTLQKTFVAVVIATSVGIGIYQTRETSRLRGRITSLEEQQAPLNEQIQTLTNERNHMIEKVASLRQENSDLQAARKQGELLKLRGEVGTLRQSLASASASNAPATGLAKMMNDPSMKEYIHRVQLNMVKERYAPLFKELNLSPENTAEFTRLIGDLWLKGSEVGSQPNREKAKEGLEDADEAMHSQLESLLGASGYARYNDFNREIPARSTVKKLDDQLANNRLTDEQSARLMQIVKAEPYESTHGITGELDTSFFGSKDDIDKHLQLVSDSNQHILQQAASFLAPDQLNSLATLQSNSLSAESIQGAALTQKH